MAPEILDLVERAGSVRAEAVRIRRETTECREKPPVGSDPAGGQPVAGRPAERPGDALPAMLEFEAYKLAVESLLHKAGWPSRLICVALGAFRITDAWMARESPESFASRVDSDGCSPARMYSC